jgi:Flp pilus assembly protein TadB
VLRRWRGAPTTVEDESDEPARAPRGPGGGRVRKRPARKRLRQPMGAPELAIYGVIVFALAFLAEKLLLRQPLLASLTSAVLAAVLVVAWQMFFENRRRRREIAQNAVVRKKRR